MDPVYPCVYREHNNPVQDSALLTGLSLCIQGTFNCFTVAIPQRRFIPVYTGNITYSGFSSHIIAVYPCVYREHKIIVFFFHAFTGLSLCIQGTCTLSRTFKTLRRFIPVYTGNIKTFQ